MKSWVYRTVLKNFIGSIYVTKSSMSLTLKKYVQVSLAIRVCYVPEKFGSRVPKKIRLKFMKFPSIFAVSPISGPRITRAACSALLTSYTNP